jgi:hypothetical protein
MKTWKYRNNARWLHLAFLKAAFYFIVSLFREAYFRIFRNNEIWKYGNRVHKIQ